MKDWNNKESKILGIKTRFKEVCPDCFAIVEKFEYRLRLDNYSTARILKYLVFLKTIHILLGMCFDKAKREDIEKLVITIDGKEYSDYTKSDFRGVIKFFFRWMIKDTFEGEYPDLVKWIKTKIKKNNQKIPEQILTKEEIELLAKATTNQRDKALVLTLYESGCRISEILHMKIKDVCFDQYGCYIMVSGKTGYRRIRLIEYSKDLLDWLDIYPFKNNADAYIWLNLKNKKEVITPPSVSDLLKDLAKKTGISKPIHPHAFRHARATHLAKQLPEAIMKQLFGWTADSKMAGVYYHLSGKDVDEALLKLHGIKSDEIKDEKVGIRVCQKCGNANSILSHFCKNCNSPLDLKVMLELDTKRKEFDNFMKEFLVYYAEIDNNFKNTFRQFVKKKNYDYLFEDIKLK